MKISVAPSVRYMIVCDEVLMDPQRPAKLMIVGLTTLVIWPSRLATPMHLEQMVVLLSLTDGRGTATGRIRCINDETGLPVFGSPGRPISFVGKDPAGNHGVIFKLSIADFQLPASTSSNSCSTTRSCTNNL